MIRPLPDRTATLFGREPDLRHLLSRGQQSGVTAVVGRAQMGKSWLLNETARRFTLKPEAQPVQLLGLTTLPPTLVGFAEAVGQEPDLLLRAVIDLYARWLASSDFKQQYKVLVAEQSHDVVGTVATVFGSLVKSVGKLVPGPTDAIGDLVKTTLDGLVSVNNTLNTGGATVARLKFDQARELLAMLHKATGSNIVLVLDQWEKSPGIEEESRSLDSILRQIIDDQGNWPPSHIFLGVRRDDKSGPVLDRLNSLQDDFPGAMEIYELQPMHLDGSDAQSLLAYIRQQVPVAKTETDQSLLDMISGYPGIVARWTSRFSVGQLDTPQELKTMADKANKYLYSEFDNLRSKLDSDALQLCIRLVLLPGASSFRPLEKLAIGALPPSALDTLKAKSILESTQPPSFGHSKRLEAALQALQKDSLREMLNVAEHLVIELSALIRNVSPAAGLFVGSLAGLARLRSTLQFSSIALGLCAAASTLLEEDAVSGQAIIEVFTSGDPIPAPAAALLSMGTLNMLIFAQNSHSLPQREQLLVGLRTLSRSFPDDPDVRTSVAMGLSNGIIYAKHENKSGPAKDLLQSLRDLATAHPEDPVVRQSLARSLFNIFNSTGLGELSANPDSYVQDLKKLAINYPDDTSVREALSWSLYNRLNSTRLAGNLDRSRECLDDLRKLNHDYPTDKTLIDDYSNGLISILLGLPVDQQNAVIQNFHNLYNADPANEGVRQRFARFLYSAVADAHKRNNIERRDALISDLKTLRQKHPHDAAILREDARAWNLLNLPGAQL